MNHILHADYKDRVSSYVMEVADKSFQVFDKIFGEPIKKSSLIHSDYNLWNIIVDEIKRNSKQLY